MRKRTLVVVLAAALGAPVSLAAQAVGIKGGVSFGNISNKGVLPGSLDNRSGMAAGFYAVSGEAAGLGLEVLFAQRGLTSAEASAEETRLDYLDLPIYLRLELPSQGIRPFAYAGPQVSYEVRCRTASGADCAADSDRKKWDYAGIIGAGVRIGGRLGFSVEGRYVYGLKDLKLSTITSEDSYQTRSFMILVGVGR